MKTGLVLEGGAMRGVFTAGVMDVFMENGVAFDGLVGVSAGAIFGSNYKSNQTGRVIRYNKKYCRNWRYCSLWSFLLTGDLFGGDFCYRKLPYELDVFDIAAFEKNPMRFFMVCTDLKTGKPVYKECNHVDKDFFKWMQASGSMPLVSHRIKIDGGEYLDGAVGDSIPLKFFEENGFEKNVVILTQPEGFIKKPSSTTGLVKFFYRKYPAFISAFANRYKLYNDELRYVEERSSEGKVIVIRPPEILPIKRITDNPDLLQKTYEIGRMTGEDYLVRVKDFLANSSV